MLRAGEPVRMRIQERRTDRVQARIGEIARAVEHHVEHNLQAACVRALDQPPQSLRVAVGRRDVLKVDHRVARPGEGRHDLNGVKAHVPNLFHFIGQLVERIDQRAVALFADKNLQQIDRPQCLFVVLLVPARRFEALRHPTDGLLPRAVVQQEHEPADRLLIAPSHHARAGDLAHARQAAAAIQSIGRACEEIAQKPRRLHSMPFRVIAAHHARAVVGRGACGDVRYDVVALPAVKPAVQIDWLVDAGHRARAEQLHARIVLLLGALDRPFKETQALRLLAVIAQAGGHLQQRAVRHKRVFQLEAFAQRHAGGQAIRFRLNIQQLGGISRALGQAQIEHLLLRVARRNAVFDRDKACLEVLTAAAQTERAVPAEGNRPGCAGISRHDKNPPVFKRRA